LLLISYNDNNNISITIITLVVPIVKIYTLITQQ